MTLFFRSASFISALIFSITGYSAELSIKYQQQPELKIVQPDGMQLVQFYAKATLPEKIDWNTALLSNFAVQTQSASAFKTLNTKLNNLENHWLREDETALVQSLRQLRREIASLHTVGRIHTRLDPDLVSLHNEYNRPLRGTYTLYLSEYTDELSVVGLINSKPSVKLKSGWSVEQYISDEKLLSGADNSYAYLIAGNGEWQKVPVAYWNKRHIEPTSGSTLFVGFSSDVLPDGMTDLNELVAAYIANRIPQ